MTRLISTVLVLTLVVCPYTCGVECCAAGERSGQNEAEPVSECCSKCGDDPADRPGPLEPAPERKPSAECNCLCAGAIKPNVDVSCTTVEMLRIAVCRPTAVSRPVVRDEDRFDDTTACDGPVRSGSALRTAISSLIC